MITYTVHEPLVSQQDVTKRADDIVFVREGFSWPALIFGLPWLLIRGLWLEFLAGLALSLALSAALLQAGLTPQAMSWAFIFLNVLLAFEFHNLERWKLERKGYRLIGVTTGDGLIDAERRFFTRWLPRAETEWQIAFEGRTAQPTGASREKDTMARARIDEPVIGFLAPDR